MLEYRIVVGEMNKFKMSFLRQISANAGLTGDVQLGIQFPYRSSNGKSALLTVGPNMRDTPQHCNCPSRFRVETHLFTTGDTPSAIKSHDALVAPEQIPSHAHDFHSRFPT